MIEGKISTELHPGNYVLQYSGGLDSISITTNVDATYDVCLQNCN